jgi:hypothetical protein
MIKKIRIIQALFIVAIIIFFSCEKQPFDFRNKYLGKWTFNINLSSWNPSRGGNYTDSYECVGDFTFGVKFDELTLQSYYYSVTFRIDKYGKLVSIYDQHTFMESGEFEGRSIFRYGYYHHQGAGPNWNSINISGSRK